MLEAEVYRQRQALQKPRPTDTHLTQKYAEFYQLVISDNHPQSSRAVLPEPNSNMVPT